MDLRIFIGLNFYADTMVLVRRQQVINHVKSFFAGGIVGPANIDEADEAAFRIVTQEGENRVDLGGICVNGQLIKGYRVTGYGRAKFCRNVNAQYRQIFSHAQRSIVPMRRIFFCNCRMP